VKNKTKGIITDDLYKIENYLQFYLELSETIEEMLSPEEVNKIKKNFDLQLMLSSVLGNEDKLFGNTNTSVN
jgi:hypothetical protein